jgi:hypothetical protein
MDIVFIVLTLLFFVLSWALLKLCERLLTNGKNTSTHES